MKSIKHLLIAAVIMPAYSYAQDIIVMRDGSIVQSKVTEITSSEVKYKKYSNLDGPLYTIDKNTILAINYENGEKDTFEMTEQATTPIAAPEVMSNEVSEEAAEENRRRIEETNSVMPEYINDKKKGDAERIFCAMGIGKESCLVNDEIEVSYVMSSIGIDGELWAGATYNQALKLVLKNKLNKTIYVDLGNSFFRRGDKATPYFIPSSTSTATSSTTGGSVNAGAVAGALGIGGTVGKLAGGINVGGGTSSSSVSVTYAQRVVAIPPMSTINLEPQLLFDEYGCDGMFRMKYDKKRQVLYFKFKKKGVEQYALGEAHDFSEQNSPLNFSIYITYSLTEDCTYTKSISSSLYLRRIVGVRKMSGYPSVTGCNLEKNVSDYDKCIYFQSVVWDLSAGKNEKTFPRP